MSDGRDLFAPRLGLTLPLCGLNFVFFFLVQADPQRTYQLFAFQPGAALAMPWTFVTYQFLNSGALGLFFGTMMLYVLGMALETEWGTPEFTAFWLAATLGGSLAAWLTGGVLTSGWQITGVSMLFAFAYLFPETQFFVFFVVPLKVKWMAWLGAALLAWTFLGAVFAGRAGAGFANVVGASAGFLWFWVRHRGAAKARRLRREATLAVKSAGAIREDAALERRNRELFPRVEALRQAARAGGDPPPDLGAFEGELRKLVVPGVNVCKPVDFKGDKDGICLKCEGFAECSLRYVRGEPAEIVVKPRG
ncbi:MAG TPA: rhomboid family intramembrane serine protease [Thermoanaerobaculia bacterium]|nr:rhomboid family intramembrane serine protease [Thermoanaerobaculia bacterium]HQR66662.1 rhomboid family intramembrane serine protease [Thermoanaerobaculia bacterium]